MKQGNALFQLMPFILIFVLVYKHVHQYILVFIDCHHAGDAQCCPGL